MILLVKGGVVRRPGTVRGLNTPLLLLVVVGVVWGTIGVTARLIDDRSDLDSFNINWVRTVIASPLMLLVAWREMPGQILRATRRDLWLMAGMGVVIIVANLLYLFGVERAGVAPATLVALCVPPVIIAIASVPLLGERLGGRAAASLVGALVGTTLLIGFQGGDAGTAFLPGIGFAFASAGFIAIHMMLSRVLAGRHPASRPLAIGFATGAVVFAPIALVRGVPWDQSLETWLLLLYLAVVPSVLGYWMYQRAMRDVTAATASIVTLLEPLVTAILAWVLFDETLAALGWAGGGLLVASIIVLSTGGASERRDAAALSAPAD